MMDPRTGGGQCSPASVLGTTTYGALDDAAVVCFLALGPRFLGAVMAFAAEDEVKGRGAAGWATDRRAVAAWRLRSMTGERSGECLTIQGTKGVSK